MPYGLFGGTYHLHHQGDKNKIGTTLAVSSTRNTLGINTIPYIVLFRSVFSIVFVRSTLWLLVTTNVNPSSLILVTLMMEAIRSSETLILTRAAGHHIPEDGILHSHCREKHKSYKGNICCMVLLGRIRRPDNEWAFPAVVKSDSQMHTRLMLRLHFDTSRSCKKYRSSCLKGH
jgi:hypothetical protein